MLVQNYFEILKVYQSQDLRKLCPTLSLLLE